MNSSLAGDDLDLANDAPEINNAVALLRSGRIIAFPTETVYGLGADAENGQAVQRIFTVKARPQRHPLIIHLAGTETLDNGGAPQYTDSNGRAFDVLRSRAVAGGTSTTATVTATVPNGKDGTVSVTIAMP